MTARRGTTVLAALLLTAGWSASGFAAVGAGAATGTPSSDSGWQTSDRQPGLRVDGPRARAVPARTGEVSYQVAPGLQFDQWDQTDARGPLRAYLLTADLSTPGLGLRYAAIGKVRKPATVPALVARLHGVAGVNGDFFDINDTFAPLGVGVTQGRVRNGPKAGWTQSFLLDAQGHPRIRRAPVRAAIVGRPRIRLTNLNSPQIPVHGIGLYTRAWGRAAGYTVVEGARRKDVRQVVVRDGRVVSKSRKLTSGSFVRGRLLVGRGSGAVALNRLRVGEKVRFTWAVKGDPRLVVSGSDRLLLHGDVLPTEDTVAHPRTAIGIDTDTGRILVLVVDGRQDFSRGLTMLEVATMMRDLGAEEALNLDGGGSSTMVARDPDGVTGVVNSPSDGHPRVVANGLAFTFRAP